MSLTVIQVETLLVRRSKAILAEVDFDLQITGVNTDLADPITYALNILDISVTDMTTPTDSEVSQVSESDYQQFLDLCEYRLLLNIAQNFDDVDVKIGHRQEEFSQLANRIIQRSDRLRTHLRDVYGLGRGELEAGVIDLDFDSSGDDTIAETAS